MANDPTVKAGSWGPKTVEKILRIQERALSLGVPMVYLVDSAGARITEQVQMFPGRRGAGRIFHNQVKLSGVVPQVCVLFGPSAAGGRLHPGLLRHRDHARRQRLDVPRLAADGRDGDRREGQPGGDGRRADAHGRLRLRAPAGQDDAGGIEWRALPLLSARRTGRGAARRSRRRCGAAAPTARVGLAIDELIPPMRTSRSTSRR
jgi:hypothetical protein